MGPKKITRTSQSATAGVRQCHAPLEVAHHVPKWGPPITNSPWWWTHRNIRRGTSAPPEMPWRCPSSACPVPAECPKRRSSRSQQIGGFLKMGCKLPPNPQKLDRFLQFLKYWKPWSEGFCISGGFFGWGYWDGTHQKIGQGYSSPSCRMASFFQTVWGTRLFTNPGGEALHPRRQNDTKWGYRFNPTQTNPFFLAGELVAHFCRSSKVDPLICDLRQHGMGLAQPIVMMRVSNLWPVEWGNSGKNDGFKIYRYWIICHKNLHNNLHYNNMLYIKSGLFSHFWSWVRGRNPVVALQAQGLLFAQTLIQWYHFFWWLHVCLHMCNLCPIYVPLKSIKYIKWIIWGCIPLATNSSPSSPSHNDQGHHEVEERVGRDGGGTLLTWGWLKPGCHRPTIWGEKMVMTWGLFTIGFATLIMVNHYFPQLNWNCEVSSQCHAPFYRPSCFSTSTGNSNHLGGLRR